MTSGKEFDYPEFDGDPSRYRSYRIAVRWLEASVKDENKHLIGPTLVRKLRGVAAELFADKDPASFRNQDGVQAVLKILDVHYNYLPETELQDATEDFLACRRGRGQGATAFTSLFKTLLGRLEQILTEQTYLDQKLDHAKKYKTYQMELIQFQFQTEKYDRQLDDIDPTDDEAVEELGPAPVAPSEPETPVKQPFKFPSVLVGYLFLRAYGLSRQQRADTIRSAGGKTQFEAIERVMRASEQAFEGTTGSWRHERGYYGDEYYEEDGAYYGDYDYSDSWDWEEADAWYGDDGDGYGEWHEEEEWPEDSWPAEDHDPLLASATGDEEEEEALITYMKARRNLMDKRKARGFAPAGTSTKQPFEPRMPPPYDPPPPGYRPAGKGKGKGKRRKGKAKGKGKSKGSSKGKGPFRTSPPAPFGRPPSKGSIPSTSTSSKGQSWFAFAFTAVAAAARSAYGFVTRALCEEEAYLSSVPGFAVIDSGCTSSLVGSECVPDYEQALTEENSELKPEYEMDNTVFAGIGGTRSSGRAIQWPTKLAGLIGRLRTSVVPGKAPLLLSVKALETMGAIIDFGKATLRIPALNNKTIGLTRAGNGHLLLPLFNFHDSDVNEYIQRRGASAQINRSRRRQLPVDFDQGLVADEDEKSVEDDDEHKPLKSAALRYETEEAAPMHSRSGLAEPRAATLLSETPEERMSSREAVQQIPILRQLARETRGPQAPWVDLETQGGKLAQLSDVPPDWQIVQGHIAYCPRVYRVPSATTLSRYPVL